MKITTTWHNAGPHTIYGKLERRGVMQDGFDVFTWMDRLRFIHDTTRRMQKLRSRYYPMSIDELKAEVNALGKRIDAARTALQERGRE